MIKLTLEVNTWVTCVWTVSIAFNFFQFKKYWK